MKMALNLQELQEKIALNYHRLADSEYYQIEGVFLHDKYYWEGDKEGRSLLAFVSHYKISGEKIPCMEQMLKALPEQLNEKQYIGEIREDIVAEQQLSGNSWFLRGLCEHYEQFGDAYSLEVLKAVTENLYLKTKGIYGSYPVDRTKKEEGGVSGTEIGVVGKWLLSSDIGCAFMSVDGLSHVYQITKDERVKELLDEMIEVYLAIDKATLRVQTHCTLSAARGMIRMYVNTQDIKYLQGAKDIYELYVNGGGMTYTYHNINWWGRPNTWSEPCAIVDSLMLALEIYKVTGEECYRQMAARIYHNAFQMMQRDNGGAGTDTLVYEGSPWTYLAMRSYEAIFCCTMRLAEGLWYVYENKDLLWYETEGQVTRKEHGIYRDGDLLYGEISGGAEEYAEHFVEVDGHKLSPIIKSYKVPREIMEKSKQQICFE